jgi:DUF1365 family protein
LGTLKLTAVLGCDAVANTFVTRSASATAPAIPAPIKTSRRVSIFKTSNFFVSSFLPLEARRNGRGNHGVREAT